MLANATYPGVLPVEAKLNAKNSAAYQIVTRGEGGPSDLSLQRFDS